MRILIYGLNYAPELTGIGKYTGEMAAWLAARGHDVEVVTAPPYYPQWAVQPGYSALRWRQERLAGARVWRCPLWVPRRPSGVTRLIHLASFALSSFAVVLWRAWRTQPQVVWMVEPTSLCAPAALLAARLARGRAWLHVQDYELDAAFGLGLVRGTRLRRWAEAVERFFKRRFDRVSTISPRMVERLERKGVEPARRVLLSNWVDTAAIHPLDAASPLRAEWGIGADTVVALYAGNLGAKQGLELLVEAARALRDRTDLLFVIAGDGVQRSALVEQGRGLPNICFVPLQPAEKLNDLLNLADIHLLPQRADAADLVMPSKLTGMLASGQPVVTTVAPGTQVAEVVGKCGVVVPPGDAVAFAQAIARLADDPAQRRSLGAAARRYAEEHLAKQRILQTFERELIFLSGCEAE